MPPFSLHRRLSSGALAIVLWSATNGLARADDAGAMEFFETRIRPVLVRHCYECHSHVIKEPKGSLLLDSREGIRRGGESGPSVVPNKVDESLLIEAIRYQSLQMPPKKQLPDAVIADFVTWVELGAPDPRDAPADPNNSARALWETQYRERLDWWSLQPVVANDPPGVRDEHWSDQPMDRFILARLEAHHLRPSPPADARTLIRRLSFALTGLPPTPADVAAFESDSIRDPDSAFRNLLSRLLDSPHFGERWARHWMDVVRYTDTYGYEWDIPAKGAWRYRDYLIRAFNNDVPFDQLVREQIAGDLLESPRINAADQINESLIGPMFFQMGENRHGDSSEFNGIHQEMRDNKIDAFSKAFQATTVACARCHDHKLDAVSQGDYYALGGIFMSSRWVANTVDLPERNAQVIAELRQVKADLRPLLADAWMEDVRRLAAELLTPVTDQPTRLQQLVEARRKEQPQLEDPLYLWTRLIAEAAEDNIASQWTAVTEAYRAESAKRCGENQAHFNFAIDFRTGVPEGWSVDGVGLDGIARCGEFVVALEGESAIERILPGGLYTNVLSPRLNGAVRTPYLSTFESGHISFECSGGDFAARRIVYDNAFLTEKQTYLTHADSKWEFMSTVKPTQDRRVYIEFATKTSNPNFPPRVGLGGATTKEQEADPRSWFGITRVALHEAPFTPKDELTRFQTLFAEEPPATRSEAAARYVSWFESAVRAWADDQATAEHVTLLNWLLANGLLTNGSEISDSALGKLIARYRQTEQRLATPWTVNGMADLEAGYDYRLNIRGDYDQLGDPIPRGYVPALAPGRGLVSPKTSGRRELAELIASPDNPLTARVYVNRVWHWLFGTGIVATPSDFGHLGDPPSHPELLDYLAEKFMQEGWSTKWLIREIVLSKTWQQAGTRDEAAHRTDPRNRLLHHYPLRRLEAEAIRDAMLAVSGRLDRRLFGPPIDPARANEDSQKRLFTGPIDGNGRRSIYTKITIMEPPKFLSLFNQPEPKIPTGHRDVTNTPAQSLALLNDPFVEGQAGFWATSLVAMDHAKPGDRLTYMLEVALGRNPTADELDRWSQAVDELAGLHHVESAGLMASHEVWTDVAHAVFNLKEFIYIR